MQFARVVVALCAGGAAGAAAGRDACVAAGACATLAAFAADESARANAITVERIAAAAVCLSGRHPPPPPGTALDAAAAACKQACIDAGLRRLVDELAAHPTVRANAATASMVARARAALL